MSDPDDDLHGRQLLLLLLFFGTVGGGLYFLGWLTRPSTLSEAPLLCFAIAGGACYPARWLAERFAWWKRLEEPTRGRWHGANGPGSGTAPTRARPRPDGARPRRPESN